MAWSEDMRAARAARRGQADWLDEPVLSFKLVCDGTDPLTNQMVIARAAHDCCVCKGRIGRGERIRYETRRSADGKTIETRRVCPTCCDAIGRGDVHAIARIFDCEAYLHSQAHVAEIRTAVEAARP